MKITQIFFQFFCLYFLILLLTFFYCFFSEIFGSEYVLIGFMILIWVMPIPKKSFIWDKNWENLFKKN